MATFYLDGAIITSTSSTPFYYDGALVTVPTSDAVAPTITSNLQIKVTPRKVITITLTANEIVTWTKTGGADQADFTLVGNVLTLSKVTPKTSKTVQITATDAAGNSTNGTVLIYALKARRRNRSL